MSLQQSEDKHDEEGFDVIAPIEFEPSRVSRRRGGSAYRWLTAVVFGVLAVLGLLAAYLFTGISVLITFEPSSAEASLEGGFLNLKLSDRWLVHPGRFVVRAEAEGYRPLVEEIVVNSDPDQEFRYSLTKLPGYLNVTTEPPMAAQAWLDGQLTADLPWSRRELAAGQYDLVLRAPRYQDFVTQIEVIGLGQEQTMSVALIPDWADVSIDTKPPGATLYVDGEPVGETPLVAEILSGRRQLELRLEGYQSWTSELTVTAQQAMALPPVTLQQSDILVAVATVPAGASVTVDGDYRGQSPMRLALPPGHRYRIGFAKAGYRSAHREVDVASGDALSLRLNLEAILGRVLVTGTPQDAEVYVDGVHRGLVNQTLSLPAHPHRVEVRREGYETYSVTVTPNPDLEQQIEADLLSFEQIKLARTPDVLTAANGYRLKLVTPSGIFRMGSPRREQGRRSNEFMRQVQLERRFYVGLLEVSNEEFLAFDSSHDSGVIERETLALRRQPAVRVSWDQAARFCNWMSERDGLPLAYQEIDGQMVPVQPMTIGYRLPSEAEWAYVARYEGQSEGRAALKYPWGEAMPPHNGNYAGVESAELVERVIVGYQDAHVASAQVGQHQANGLGLFDIGGNVREWMHDYYTIRPSNTGAIPVDPLGPESGTTHVLRGSSWRSASITELRLAFRDEGVEGDVDIGLRIARYAE